jgi:hypothetical protein
MASGSSAGFSIDVSQHKNEKIRKCKKLKGQKKSMG